MRKRLCWRSTVHYDDAGYLSALEQTQLMPPVS